MSYNHDITNIDCVTLQGAPARKVNVVNKAERGGQVGLAGQEFQARKVSLATLALMAHEELKDSLERLCQVGQVHLEIKVSHVASLFMSDAALSATVTQSSINQLIIHMHSPFLTS